MCGGVPPEVAVASMMEIRAGLRWVLGRERIRSRRALPSVQAVSAVKDWKVCSWLDSWAIKTWGWVVLEWGFWDARSLQLLTSVLGAESAEAMMVFENVKRR